MKYLIMQEIRNSIKSKISIALVIFTILYIFIILSFDLNVFKGVTPYLIEYEGTWNENKAKFEEFQANYKSESEKNHYLLNPDTDDIPAQANLMMNISITKMSMRENWLTSIYPSDEYNQKFAQKITNLPPTQYRILYMWINANDYLTGGVGFLAVMILIFLLANQYHRDSGMKELQVTSKAGLNTINKAKFYSSIIIGIVVGIFFATLTVCTRLLSIGFYNSDAPLNSMFIYTPYNISVGLYMLILYVCFVMGCGYFSAILHKFTQKGFSAFICSLIGICIAILPGLSITTEIYSAMNVPQSVINLIRIFSPMTIMTADYFKQHSSIICGAFEITVFAGTFIIFSTATIFLFITRSGRGRFNR